MPHAKASSAGILLRIHPLHKMVISLALSLAAWLILQKYDLDWKMQFLVLWIVFSTTYLTFSWLLFVRCSGEEVRNHAGKEDGSRAFVFLIIVLSSFIGMFTVLLLIISGPSAHISKWIFLSVVVVSMFLSWCMVHTTFCFHYAYLYFIKNKGTGKISGGLDFPGQKEPDYLDFAYFSFVLGMTFQVSDVQVTSQRIRRQALLHGLLAFALNTIVVALTFNLVAGLMKS